MPVKKRIHIDQTDPEHFEAIDRQQRIYRKEFNKRVSGAMMCPYCRNILMYFAGSRGMTQVKCNRCGQEVVFPPITQLEVDELEGAFASWLAVPSDELERKS